MEEQKTQNALRLRKQIEELCREVDLERAIEREKTQLLLQQYHEDGAQLQQEVRIDVDSDDPPPPPLVCLSSVTF